MNSADTSSSYLSALQFTPYSAQEIRNLSVKEVRLVQSFDALGHANEGGFYDSAYGATDRDEYCGTCGLGSTRCPGHMGHINLPLPVYNTLFFSKLVEILKKSCLQCCHLNFHPANAALFCAQMRALNLECVEVINELADIAKESGKDVQIDDFKEKLNMCLAKYEAEFRHPAEHQPNTRLLSSLKGGIFDRYWRTEFLGARCVHCGCWRRALYSERSEKIYFSKSSGAKATKTKKQKQRKQPSRDAEETILMDDDAEKERKQKQGEQEVKETVADTAVDVDQYITPEMAKRFLRGLWANHKEELGYCFEMLKVTNAGKAHRENVSTLTRDTENRNGGVFGSNEEDDEGEHPTDVFFIEAIAVPPSKFRPINIVKSISYDNTQSYNLQKVLRSVESLKEALKEVRDRSPTKAKDITVEELKGGDDKQTSLKVFNCWQQLQVHVNCVIDGEQTAFKKDKSIGVRQLLEKKQGLIRNHMMGKRVNQACRSVISPDPNINTDEIGVPMVFATKLTYREPVTPTNYHELYEAVLNGPDVHPGATRIISEDGFSTHLGFYTREEREAFAKRLLTTESIHERAVGSKTVLRHIRNGDVLLLNRQPTLHRPSIQAHKARILRGEKTLRLHYANCKAYNADFDGDEMNAHFPQDELARSEAYNLMATHNNYLVPKDGTPLAGLIQDHMVSGVLLTIRGRFFNRYDYQQLVFSGLTDCQRRIKLLPPSMLKPQQLWSGKQVLSTVLINIIPKDKPAVNLDGVTKISDKNWVNLDECTSGDALYGSGSNHMSESEVVIRAGELLQGVLDKGHYGATPYGLVHCVYQLYGGKAAGQLLSCLARLFTSFLQWHGFTLGVEDILVTNAANKKRADIMSVGRKSGLGVAREAFNMPLTADLPTLTDKYRQAYYGKDAMDLRELDLKMKSKTDDLQNQVVKACMPLGLEKKFPHNNLQLMVQSGAKGSTVNAMQISCLLGQIELEGRRPPLMVSGRSLPSFSPFDPSPRAGGFVDGRFLTGILPQEYFFHCMAGREGLVDTAVKTSRSGYLQRCMIKHLEGLCVAYDMTVRESDGTVIQFQYGEDGRDVNKTAFLKEKQFPFLMQNSEAMIKSEEIQRLKSTMSRSDVNTLWKTARKWHKYKKELKNSGKLRISDFTRYSQSLLPTAPELKSLPGRTQAAVNACANWKSLSQTEKNSHKLKMTEPDPVSCVYRPDLRYSAVCEKFNDTLEEYIEKNPDKLLHSKDTKHGKSPKRKKHKKDKRDSSRLSYTADTAVGGAMKTDPEQLRDLLYALYVKSCVQPGDAVGSIAAQSIGEPSTQMTLNTFHFAGRGDMNVTLGIPRLREILMIAAKSILTPNMAVPVKNTPKALKFATALAKYLNQVKLGDVLEKVNIVEELEVSPKKDNVYTYDITMHFLPRDDYEEYYSCDPHQIIQAVEKHFFREFYKELEAKTKGLHSTINRIRSGQVKEKKDKSEEGDNEEEPSSAAASKFNGNDGDDDSDDDVGNDGDATAERQKRRQHDDEEYEGEEEEAEEVREESDSDGEEIIERDSREVDDTSSDEMYDSESNEVVHKKKKKKQATHVSAEKQRLRIARIMRLRTAAAIPISLYDFDRKGGTWCRVKYELPLDFKNIDVSSSFTDKANNYIIHKVKGITKALLSKDRQGVTELKTEGVNMTEMCKYQDYLDINKLTSNDIHAMASTYGIEAAGRMLIQECRDVFGAYGITVDYRHLSLIADYMTTSGEYVACNRHGIVANTSPLQKMTFETSVSFLKQAAIHGETDDLCSPSSQIVAGKLVKVGTGAFDVLRPTVMSFSKDRL